MQLKIQSVLSQIYSKNDKTFIAAYSNFQLILLTK